MHLDRREEIVRCINYFLDVGLSIWKLTMHLFGNEIKDIACRKLGIWTRHLHMKYARQHDKLPLESNHSIPLSMSLQPYSIR